MRHSTVFALMIPFLTPAAMANESPFSQADDTWVNMTGTAIETGPDSFYLDYGQGTILVEMDDWSTDADAAPIFNGDEVRVYGEIDDDFSELATIEAESVYVENLGVYFYANSTDEESARFTNTAPIIVGQTEVIGTVTSVTGREFTVDKGNQMLTVDTLGMDYNPLDDRGFQQVDVGDLISVTGNMEENIIDTMELEADSLVILDEQS
ncbi:hypothetical protein [Methylophaga sp. OBS1]|jgi:uncharacterized protein YdeI (BOF family)|uniref:hypothetical protein n=1 Tax=Methylophaga sp. OBS1 TaxID=2991933 RepID=UPI00225756B3|nr:hypothetical protein [Methylophaga sp. OBS1]MCX4191153.1 hypothetical protein [Methylophaga sp. OBS1]MCX4191901.1 hypothetical protein [Methylophaga sp. OBS1]